MVSAYPELVGAIAKMGLTKTAIAKEIGITPRTLYAKLSGETEFTLKEANAIRNRFFPDMSQETLFARTEQDSA